MRTPALLALLLALAACGGEEAPPPQVPPPSPPAELPTPPPVTATAEAPPPPAPKPPMADMQKAAMMRARDALNAHDAKAFAGVYADGAVISVAGLNDVTGRDAIEANMREWFDTFSGMKVGFNRVWMKDDVVLLEWVVNGTQSGDLLGVKGTNAPVGHAGLSVLYFDPDGYVKAEHRYGDLGTVMTQVGAAKQPARPIPSIPDAPQIAVATGSADEAKNLDTAKALYASLEKKSEGDFVPLLADDVEYDGLIHVLTVKGKAEGKKFFESLTRAFPDLKFSVSNGWGVADYALVEYVVTGTQKGALGTLAPSQRPINVHAVDVFRIKDGKIAKAATYSNSLELMTELGLFQPKR